MFLRLAGACIALTLASAPPSFALTECQSNSNRNARDVDLSLGSPAGSAFMLFLADAAQDLAATSPDLSCTRGPPIIAGAMTFQLGGENRDEIPRLAVGANDTDPILFVRPVPRRVLARYGALVGDARVPRDAHVLILQSAEEIVVVRVFRSLPSDRQLTEIIGGLGDGFSAVLSVDRRSGQVVLFAGDE